MAKAFDTNVFMKTINYRTCWTTGGFGEEPRKSTGTETDLIKSKIKGMKTMVINKKVPETSRRKKDYMFPFNTQHAGYRGEGTAPSGTGFSDRERNAHQLLNGAHQRGYNPAAVLSQSYKVACEGNQSIDVHTRPLHRTAAVESYQELICPYGEKEPVTLGDMTNNGTQFRSSFALSQSLKQKFRPWPELVQEASKANKKVLIPMFSKIRVKQEKRLEDYSSDEEELEEVGNEDGTITYKGKGTHRITTHTEGTASLIEHDPVDLSLSMQRGHVCSKSEKRAPEPRNIGAYPAATIVDQKSMEDLSKQGRGDPNCTNHLSNEQMFASFREQYTNLSKRTTRVHKIQKIEEGLLKTETIYKDNSSDSEQEMDDGESLGLEKLFDDSEETPMHVEEDVLYYDAQTHIVSVDNTGYHQTIMNTELVQQIMRTNLEFGDAQTAALFLSGLTINSMRDLKFVVQLHRCGRTAQVGGGYVCRSLYRQLYTLKEKGGEYLFKALLAQRTIPTVGERNKKRRFHYDKVNWEKEDIGVLIRNPGRVFFFVYAGMLCKNTLTVATRLEMGMGFANILANESQAERRTLDHKDIVDYIGPVQAVQDYYNLENFEDPFAAHDSAIVDDDYVYHRTPAEIYNMSSSELAEWQDAYQFQAGIHELFPCKEQILTGKERPINENRSMFAVAKSDDGVLAVGTEGVKTAKMMTAFHLASHENNMRKVSTKKTIIDEEQQRGTLYGALMRKGKFYIPATRDKRAIFPSRISPDTDFANTYSVAWQTAMRGNHAAAYVLKQFGVMLTHQTYRLHPVYDVQKYIDSRTSTLIDMLNSYEDVYNTPMHAGGFNIINITCPNMDFNTMQIYFSGPEAHRMVNPEIQESEHIEGQRRSKTGSAQTLGCFIGNSPSVESVQKRREPSTVASVNPSIAKMYNLFEKLVETQGTTGNLRNIVCQLQIPEAVNLIKLLDTLEDKLL